MKKQQLSFLAGILLTLLAVGGVWWFTSNYNISNKNSSTNPSNDNSSPLLQTQYDGTYVHTYTLKLKTEDFGVVKADMKMTINIENGKVLGNATYKTNEVTGNIEGIKATAVSSTDTDLNDNSSTLPEQISLFAEGIAETEIHSTFISEYTDREKITIAFEGELKNEEIVGEITVNAYDDTYDQMITLTKSD